MDAYWSVFAAYYKENIQKGIRDQEDLERLRNFMQKFYPAASLVFPLLKEAVSSENPKINFNNCMQNLEYILGVIEENACSGANKDALAGTAAKWFLGWYEKVGCSPREVYELELKARMEYQGVIEEVIKTKEFLIESEELLGELFRRHSEIKTSQPAQDPP